MDRRSSLRSNAHDFDYPHVGQKITIDATGTVHKNGRLFRVSCWRSDCDGYSLRTPSTINRKRRNNNPMGCCMACSKYKPENEWTCYWCGKEFYKPTGYNEDTRDRAYCSKECYTEWQKSEEYRGSNNPNWTDSDYDYGRTDIPEYRHWREDVFDRDNYTCQRCGDRGVRLNAHHIIAYALDSSLEYVNPNGVALCEDCHKWVHRTENCGLKCDSSDFLLRHEVITESQYEHLQAHVDPKTPSEHC